MKHIQNKELFENVIKRKVRPISDFIYQKFFDNSNYTYPKMTEKERNDMVNNKLKYQLVEVRFCKNDYAKFSKEDFLLFAEFINWIDEFCKRVEFKIPGCIQITMYFTPDELQKIKDLPEFKEWLTKADAESKAYIEDREMKKVAKKYNL